MSKLHFNSAEEAQRTYDDFAERHTKDVHNNQAEIDRLLDRDNKEVDRSGKHIEEVLKQARDNQKKLLASAMGYINQAKKAQADYQYKNEDYNRLEKYRLPKNSTYCCVMKREGLSRKEDIERRGLKEKDLSILFRLIPCVGFETGILLNDISIPFNSVDEIAEYLGEKKGNDSATGQAIRRLKEAGIIFKYGDFFIVDDSYIRCGKMTTGVLQKRHNKLKQYKDKQGKKGGVRQGKKQVQKKQKKEDDKTTQTQVGSEQETDTEMPF